MKKIILFFLFMLFINVDASIVVMDADSSRVLYNKNMDERKLIASTTKIMTSLIALENSDINKIIIVGDEVKSVDGSMIYLKPGDKISLKDLLYGLMLRSGNDAAMSIATNTIGYDNFIAKMNLKAFILGMQNTTFENPHGLNYDTKNYSTAYDMALLMKYAIKNKDFLKISSCKKYKNWYNKNKLLSTYKYSISGKIGYTESSGPVFVSASKKDNKTLIIVSINEADKFNLHERLYKKYFNEYNRYKVLDKNTFSFKVKNNNFDHYYILNDFYMLLKENEVNKVNVKINLSKQINYVSVFFDKRKIHNEKIFVLSYKNRTKSIKELLSIRK